MDKDNKITLLTATITLIDVMAERGAIKGPELFDVGTIRGSLEQLRSVIQDETDNESKTDSKG